jgi:hypothetical protein
MTTRTQLPPTPSKCRGIVTSALASGAVLGWGATLVLVVAAVCIADTGLRLVAANSESESAAQGSNELGPPDSVSCSSGSERRT